MPPPNQQYDRYRRSPSDLEYLDWPQVGLPRAGPSAELDDSMQVDGEQFGFGSGLGEDDRKPDLRGARTRDIQAWNRLASVRRRAALLEM